MYILPDMAKGAVRAARPSVPAGFAFAQDPNFNIEDIGEGEVRSAYRMLGPTHMGTTHNCKKNCQLNPRCLSVLGEKVWLEMEDDEESESELMEDELVRFMERQKAIMKQKKMLSQYEALRWEPDNSDDEDEDMEESFEFLPLSWLNRWLSNPLNCGSIETKHLLCQHNSLDIERVSEVKVCYSETVSLLYSEYGKGEGPRLLSDKLCRICVRNRARLISHDFRMARDQQFLVDVDDLVSFIEGVKPITKTSKKKKLGHKRKVKGNPSTKTLQEVEGHERGRETSEMDVGTVSGLTDSQKSNDKPKVVNPVETGTRPKVLAVKPKSDLKQESIPYLKTEGGRAEWGGYEGEHFQPEAKYTAAAGQPRSVRQIDKKTEAVDAQIQVNDEPGKLNVAEGGAGAPQSAHLNDLVYKGNQLINELKEFKYIDTTEKNVQKETAESKAEFDEELGVDGWDEEEQLLVGIRRSIEDELNELKAKHDAYADDTAPKMEKVLNSIEMTENEIHKREKVLSAMEEEFETVRGEIQKFNVLKAEFVFKKVRLEDYMRRFQSDYDIKINDVKLRLEKAMENLERHQMDRNNDKKVSNKNVNQSVQMFDLITDHIAEKKRDLECPVCTDVAQPPIYMCRDSHLICSICVTMLNKCPTCREVYIKPILRNRMAERILEDLQKLQNQRDRIREI